MLRRHALEERLEAAEGRRHDILEDRSTMARIEVEYSKAIGSSAHEIHSQQISQEISVDHAMHQERRDEFIREKSAKAGSDVAYAKSVAHSAHLLKSEEERVELFYDQKQHAERRDQILEEKRRDAHEEVMHAKEVASTKEIEAAIKGAVLDMDLAEHDARYQVVHFVCAVARYSGLAWYWRKSSSCASTRRSCEAGCSWRSRRSTSSAHATTHGC